MSFHYNKSFILLQLLFFFITQIATLFLLFDSLNYLLHYYNILIKRFYIYYNMKTVLYSPNIEKTEQEIENDKIRASSSFNFLSEIIDYDKEFTHKEQITMINNLYNKLEFDYDKKIIKDLKTKITSYMQQDKLKTLYNITNFITLDKVIEKLFLSNLICHYCSKNIYIIYKYKRASNQWTLDRVDNSEGHNYNNVVICCLKCNLSRRCLDSNKFLFTKKLNIIKT